jgi:hypothetical protein
MLRPEIFLRWRSPVDRFLCVFFEPALRVCLATSQGLRKGGLVVCQDKLATGLTEYLPLRGAPTQKVAALLHFPSVD